MKDEKNFVVPKTIEYVLDCVGDIYNRANKLIEEIEYLKELCEQSDIVIKWKDQIKEHNYKKAMEWNREYDIDGYIAYLESLTDSMLDAVALFDAEIKYQESQEAKD